MTYNLICHRVGHDTGCYRRSVREKNYIKPIIEYFRELKYITMYYLMIYYLENR